MQIKSWEKKGKVMLLEQVTSPVKRTTAPFFSSPLRKNGRGHDWVKQLGPTWQCTWEIEERATTGECSTSFTENSPTQHQTALNPLPKISLFKLSPRALSATIFLLNGKIKETHLIISFLSTKKKKREKRTAFVEWNNLKREEIIDSEL